MNWKEFFKPTKGKIIVASILIFLSLIVFYNMVGAEGHPRTLWDTIIESIYPILLLPTILLLKTVVTKNIFYWIFVFLVNILYLYVISLIFFLPYRNIMTELLKSVKEKFLILLLSIILWFLLMSLLTKTFTLGMQLFTFIPVILATVIAYKIIEKIFNLQKIRIFGVIFIGFIGWLLSWWIFGILPECGSSYYGWGSRSVECDCKGIEITVDTSWALDAYGSVTKCLGIGKSYLGSPYKEIIIEKCIMNNCQDSISLNVDSDEQNETVNCKTGVIKDETYNVNMRGVCG